MQPAAHDPPIAHPKTSDPVAEAAIIAFIGTERWLDIEDNPLKPEDFIVEHWGIIYRAARQIWSKKTVCISSINEWIEENCAIEFQRSMGGQTVNWRDWWSESQKEAGLGSSLSNILDACERIARYARNREEYAIRQGVGDGSIAWEEAFERIENLHHGQNGALPSMESATSLCANPPETPPELIAGVLHQGSKMLIGGGSKSFKSWSLIHLALCISSGVPWLKFKTSQTPVLYLNFELPRFAITTRLKQVSEALGIPIPDNLTLWNLRGHSAEASSILPLIARSAARHNFGFIVIDPLYKLLGSKDENLSRDMAELMNAIEHMAVEINAAVASGSHFSKGDQSLRAAIDRISGSGVFGRDPDSIVTLTQHEEDDALSVEMILRNFPPQPKFVVRWKHPLLTPDEELDPENLRSAIRKEPKIPTDQYLEFINGNGLSYSDWFDAAHESLGVSRPTFDRARKDLLERGKIFKSEIDGKWSTRV